MTTNLKTNKEIAQELRDQVKTNELPVMFFDHDENDELNNFYGLPKETRYTGDGTALSAIGVFNDIVFGVDKDAGLHIDVKCDIADEAVPEFNEDLIAWVKSNIDQIIAGQKAEHGVH